MEYVEGKNRLITVSEYLVVEIQVPCTQAKDKDNPAPAGSTYYNLKEYIYPGEGLTSRVAVIQ